MQSKSKNPTTTEYQSQLHINLRMKMKRLILDSFTSSEDIFKGSFFEGGGGFLMGGSTVLTIARQQSYKFPMHAQKSGDLDLYLYKPTDKSFKSYYDLYTSPDIYRKTIKSKAVPYLEKLMPELGIYPVEEAVASQKRYTQATWLKKRYTRQEAESALVHEDFLSLWQPEDREYVDVLLEFDLIGEIPLLLLDPIRADHFKSDSSPVYFDNPLNVLAQKN